MKHGELSHVQLPGFFINIETLKIRNKIACYTIKIRVY